MRYILTLMMTSALAFGFACQSASSSSTVIKNENPASLEKATAEKSADSPEEHNKDKAPRISLADAKKAFDAGNTIFVDTRGKASFNNEHIKGAINVPMREFEDNYKGVPKDKKIIAYCS